MSENTKPDPVLQYLIAMNLGEHEAEFRSLLAVLSPKEEPRMRHIVVATVGVLMGIGGIHWSIVMRVVTLLNDRTDEQLSSDDAVGLTNGTHLVIPSNTEDGVSIFDLRSGVAFTGALPPPMVSTIYSVNAIWAHAEGALKK